MFRKDGNGKKGVRQVIPLGASKPMPVGMKRWVEESDEEDEEGRSGLGRSKRGKKEKFEEGTQEEGKPDLEAREQSSLQEVVVVRGKKRSSNYLDEVLAEKQRKKKKRVKRKAGLHTATNMEALRKE